MATTIKKSTRLKRRIYKNIYPALIKAGKVFGLKAGEEKNNEKIKPFVSFYSLQATANKGEVIAFEKFKGKKVLIVNTASNCGYTPQFSELKQLHELYSDRLHIIGFPSNDFKEQEKGSDEEIATFCIGTFGIQFPLMKKSKVLKGEDQNEVFNWLTSKEKNGWNDKQPEWNFSKYLIDENGILMNYFGTGVSPLSKIVIRAISVSGK